MSRILTGTKANVPYEISFTVTNSLKPQPSPGISIILGSQVNTEKMILNFLDPLAVLKFGFSDAGFVERTNTMDFGTHLY